jgi:hypothetical protein
VAKTSWDRRGEARAALRTVVSDPDYGVTALSSPQVMSGLLKDLLPDSPREAGVLVAAAEAHLADMLHDHRAQGMDSDTACALAAQTFAARTAFAPEACSWVVGELAAAVGFDTSGGGQAGALAGSVPPTRTGPFAAAVTPGTAPSGTELPRDWQPTMTAAGPAAGLGRHRVTGQRNVLKLCAVGVVAVVVAALIWYFATSARQANSAASAGPTQSAVSGPQGTVYAGDRYGFKTPSAVAVGGGHVWVANSGTVIEVDASTGRWVQTRSYGEYGITSNAAITSDGTDVWEANANANQVTELDARTGRWMRTLSGGSYGFDYPAAIAVGGGHVWVANTEADSVTELDASTGRWVQTLSGGSYGFVGPTGIAVDGGHVWISNSAAKVGHGGSVTELDASTGRWMRTLSGGSYGFNGSNAIAAGDGDVWVANIRGFSVTELDASTGHWVRTLGAGNLIPVAFALDGADVWVLNGDNGVGAGSVIELDASTGRLVRTLRGEGYSTPSALAVDGGSLWVASLYHKGPKISPATTAVPTLTEVPTG